jgi:thymidylate kinase
MGAAELDGSWRYGRFEPDFFFELAGRSRVASVARDHLARGEVVLCKCFTLSSMAHAALQRHDWVREGLGALEARARGLPGRELLADLTIFIDVAPETAAAELGPSRSPHFSKVDLETQRQVYLEQLAGPSVGPVKVIAGSRSAEALFPEALAAIRALG